MEKLKLAKNQGSKGCTWHVMKKEDGEWRSLCGKIDKPPEKKFQGFDSSPGLGSWCGQCRKTFTSNSFKGYRTKGRLMP